MTAEGGLVMTEMAGLRWSEMTIWWQITMSQMYFSAEISLTVATTFVRNLIKKRLGAAFVVG
jgi:hypothetical protein